MILYYFLLGLLVASNILVAYLEAMMDIYSHEKWDKSVYVQLDKWCKRKFKNTKYTKYFFDQLMWKNKYENRHPENPIRRIWSFKIHPAFTDFWHLAKSSMQVIQWLQVILSCYLVLNFAGNISSLLFVALVTVGAAIMRNIAFNKFYHKTLINGDK